VAAALCVLALPPAVRAQPKIEILTNQDQILKRFPRDTGLLAHGVRVRLKSGGWVEISDNPFGKAPPTLCWYAPALHVAGVCQNAVGVAVTILIELNTGRRVSAPGVPVLMPEKGLVAIGPDAAHGVDSDSVTLVKIEADDLVDEGGALFDQDFGPGAWVDGDCYRLTARGAKGGAWLERTASGWRQAEAAESTVCQGRHGR
jgi:hypothetical protein